MRNASVRLPSPLPSPLIFSFFSTDTAPPVIYTLSLHDALPISSYDTEVVTAALAGGGELEVFLKDFGRSRLPKEAMDDRRERELRSEEHTSELQSHSDLVCRLLLEKKNKKKDNRVKELT